MMHNRIFEISERALKGPICEPNDFDRMITKKVRSLIKEYDIKYDPQILIPTDKSLIDDVYRAGVDLFLELGALCLDTERRILFTEKELKDVLKSKPEQVNVGMGDDARVVRKRVIEDRNPPFILGGPTGTIVTEGDIFVKHHQGICQEKVVDAYQAGALSTIGGKRIIKGSPLEVIGAQNAMLWTHKALENVGRPGLHIADNAAAISTQAKIATCNPRNGIKPSDGMIVSQMAEMKVDYEHLSRMAFLLEYGASIYNLMTPIIGGYAPGAAGVTIVTIAEHLIGEVVYHATFHHMSHTHIRFLNNANRWGLWAEAMVGQALSRNTNILTFEDAYCANGPSTKDLLYEVACDGMVSAVAGMQTEGVGTTGGKYPDHHTGLEIRLLGEVAHAASDMKREDVNDILNQLLPKFEEKLVNADKGKPFRECYDLKTVKPSNEWMNLYTAVKQELIDLGINIT